MEVDDDFVSILQELFWLAVSFGPSPASYRDVLLDFRDSTIGAGCRKALGLNAHNLRIKIPGDRLHVIAIDCGEEIFQCFSFGAHRFVRLRPEVKLVAGLDADSAGELHGAPLGALTFEVRRLAAQLGLGIDLAEIRSGRTRAIRSVSQYSSYRAILPSLKLITKT